MTMHLIVCPHCGKQMKTKVLVKGTIRCPGCQVRFKAPEPHPGVAATIQYETAHDKGQIIASTGIGFLFVFSFFATGALQALDTFLSDDDMTPLIFAPFYAAQMLLALYFFMPLMYWLFGKAPNSRAKQVVAPNSSEFTGFSRPPLAQESNRSKDIMRISLAIGLVLAIISVVIGGAILWFLVDLGLQILSSGGCC